MLSIEECNQSSFRLVLVFIYSDSCLRCGRNVSDFRGEKETAIRTETERESALHRQMDRDSESALQRGFLKLGQTGNSSLFVML